MRIKFIIIIFLSCFNTLWSQDNYLDNVKDCLKKKHTNEARNQLLINEIRRNQDNENFISLSRLLLKESIRQKDLKLECKADYYILVYWYNKNNIDSTQHYSERLRKIALPHKHYYEYYNGQRLLIDLYSFNNKYDRALTEALYLKKEAEIIRNPEGIYASQLSLANIYIATNQYREAISILQSIIPKEIDGTKLESITQIIIAYDALRDNSNVLFYLDKMKETLNSIEKEHPNSKQGFSDPYLFTEIMSAAAYVRMNDTKRAQLHLQLALKDITDSSFPLYQAMYHKTCSDYYCTLKNYKQALVENQKASAYVEEFNKEAYIDLENQKANIYLSSNKPLQAIKIYEQILPMTDSLNFDINQKQINEIERNNQLKSNLMGKIEIIHRSRTILLLVFIFGFLMLLFFINKLLHVAKTLRKTKKETEKALEIAERTNSLKGKFLQNISYEIRTPLNAIVGFSDVLTQDSSLSKEMIKKYSDIITQNTASLLTLINNILDFSRLEAGMMHFTETEENVIELIQNCIHKIEEQYKSYQQVNFITDYRRIVIKTDCLKFMSVMNSVLGADTYGFEIKPMKIKMVKDSVKKMIHIYIYNSILTDADLSNEGVIMRNNINRLIISHFNGSYRIDHEDDNRLLIITYPFIADY